jgi:hypothetical protein
MRLYYLVMGNYDMAARVAISGSNATEDDTAALLRWHPLFLADLLEAGEYDELDEILSGSYRTRVDVIELIKCVLAGRRGEVRSDTEWLALREHFTTVSSDTTVKKLGYLVEVAYQRGDIEYARRRAAIARTRPVVRLPVNHRVRATIEAVALGRNPADRRIIARLNNRAEHWSNDGRPEDPLTGLCLVVAQRWINGAGRTQASTVSRELVNCSHDLLGERLFLLLHSTRHCVVCRADGQVKDMSVCGDCHQVFCVGCAHVARPAHVGRCGGTLVHP